MARLLFFLPFAIKRPSLNMPQLNTLGERKKFQKKETLNPLQSIALDRKSGQKKAKLTDVMSLSKRLISFPCEPLLNRLLMKECRYQKSLLTDFRLQSGQTRFAPCTFALSALRPRRYMITGHGHSGPPEDHPGGSSCGSERLFRCR